MAHKTMRKLLLVLALLLLWHPRGFSEQKKAEVILFYSPHCRACLQLKGEILPPIIEHYKEQVTLHPLDITANPENLNFLMSLSSRFHKKSSLVPAILVGDQFLVGKDQIKERLGEAIEDTLRTERKIVLSFSQKTLLEKFKEISPLTLIWAGLIDGINPCAFAVIVFFISFLAVYGYKKQEIVYIGIFYMLAVFLTYLLIGLGIFNFLYVLSNFYSWIKVFYYFIAGFCFLLVIFALYDYLRFMRTKETDGLILQLPKFFKTRINLVIGQGLRQKRRGFLSLSVISFIVGFFVSLLEAVCTGQVYLPTIFFIFKIPQLRLKALFYLIVYNIVFIFPLFVVFILSFLGFRSQQFNAFLKKHLAIIKLSMVVLFLILGISILILS